MHNGYCAKWKCESTSSATAGSCSGNYNGWEGKCTGRGRYSSICSGETMQFEGACKKLCYHNNQASECQNNEIGVCQWNAKECVNFDQASCTANTQHGCTRTPGSSSSTHTLKCVKADGSQATGCKDTWTKPQCPPAATTPSNPTPTPTACTPGKEETKGPNSIGDPCTVGKRTCLGNGTWSNWEYPTAPFADASCVNGALLYCGTGGQPSENGDHCECINNSGKIYLGIKWSGQNVNYHDLLMQQASQLLLVPNATWSDICGVTP